MPIQTASIEFTETATKDGQLATLVTVQAPGGKITFGPYPGRFAPFWGPSTGVYEHLPDLGIKPKKIPAKKNKRARRTVKRLGFIEEGTMLRAFDGVNDLCIYGITQENWRTGKFGPRPQKELKDFA